MLCRNEEILQTQSGVKMRLRTKLTKEMRRRMKRTK